MSNDAMREAFERAYEKAAIEAGDESTPFARNEAGDYLNMYAQAAWWGYQAALAAPAQSEAKAVALTDEQFIAEHGDRLATMMAIDSYDIADRDAQIARRLAPSAAPAQNDTPSQMNFGADATLTPGPQDTFADGIREAARLIQMWQSFEPAHSTLHDFSMRDASRIISSWPARLRGMASDYKDAAPAGDGGDVLTLDGVRASKEWHDRYRAWADTIDGQNNHGARVDAYQQGVMDGFRAARHAPTGADALEGWQFKKSEDEKYWVVLTPEGCFALARDADDERSSSRILAQLAAILSKRGEAS